MKPIRDPHLHRDFLKLGFLCATVVGTLALFAMTPAFFTPTLLSILAAIFLSPWISALERKGLSRNHSIGILFCILLLIAFFLGFWGIQAGLNQWELFKERAPHPLHTALEKIQHFEKVIKIHYPFLNPISLTELFESWTKESTQWFIDRGAALIGQTLTSIFIVPFLTFLLLVEGRSIRKNFFQLAPNRYFESFFLVSTEIFTAISGYIRAKLFEAVLVGLIVSIGITLIHGPFALILGVFAGLTNILPYIGPFLGAIPGILITAFDPTLSHLSFSITTVYLAANVIDATLIFPIVVANLVNLHPLILVVSVAVGQQYYGLIGMLISIPVATALKVIFREVHRTVYGKQE